MSEDEAIQKCKNIVSHKNDKDIAFGKSFIHHYMMSIEDHEAIETILDLYQQEKEDYAKLSKYFLVEHFQLENFSAEFVSKDRIRELKEDFNRNLIVLCGGRSARKAFNQAVLNGINQFIDKILEEK